MPETGSSILSYIGNANNGLALNTAIPVAAERPDLEAVNQAAQNLRLYDHQNNILLYNQKIADRDKSLQLLAQNKINSGKILPEDQAYYDQLEKEQTDAWKNIKGLQDKEGMANYLTKSQQLQDAVTNMQHRWIEIRKLDAEKSKKSLPKDIAAYDNHIKSQRAKAIGELIDPYQKSFSGDFDKMRNSIRGSQMITKGVGGQLPPQPQETVTVTDKDGKQTVKTVTAPPKQTGAPVTKKGTTSTTTVTPAGGSTSLSIFQETPEKYYDYPTMLKRSEQLYLGDPEEAESQRQWFKNFHEAPPFIQKDIIEKYNNRIKEYNDQRGIEPDANGNYPDLIKFRVLPDGKIILDETPASFAAKDALASIEGDYVEKGQKVFNKDIANYLLENKKIDADAIFQKGKLANDAIKARAYAANIRSQIKLREGDPEEQTKLLDDVWTRNLLQQDKLTINDGKQSIFQAKLENNKSLPLFTFNSQGKPTLLAPIGGKPITDKSGKIIGYEGGHYSQQYIYNERPADLPLLWSLYNTALPSLKKAGFEGSFDDYLKGMIEQSALNVKLIGQNGSSDKQVNTSALKAISNPLTKKEQEGVFEVPLPSEPEE